MRKLIYLLAVVALYLGSCLSATNAQNPGIIYRDTCIKKNATKNQKNVAKKTNSSKKTNSVSKKQNSQNQPDAPANTKTTKKTVVDFDTTAIQSGAGIAIGKIVMRNDYPGSGMQECFLAPLSFKGIEKGKMLIRTDSGFSSQKHFIFDTRDSLGHLLYLSVKQFEGESQNSTITVSGIRIFKDSPEAERLKANVEEGIAESYDNKIAEASLKASNLSSYVQKFSGRDKDSLSIRDLEELNKKEVELSLARQDTTKLSIQKKRKLGGVEKYINAIIKRGVYLADNVIKMSPIDPGVVTTGSLAMDRGASTKSAGYAGSKYSAKEYCYYCYCLVPPGTDCPSHIGPDGKQRCHSFECDKVAPQQQQQQQTQTEVIIIGGQQQYYNQYVTCGYCRREYLFGERHSCYGPIYQSGRNYSQWGNGWGMNAGGYWSYPTY